MSRWGELIPHDEGAAEEGRCLCGCQDDGHCRTGLCLGLTCCSYECSRGRCQSIPTSKEPTP